MADITAAEVRTAMERFGAMSVADARVLVAALTSEERRDIGRACRTVLSVLDQHTWDALQRIPQNRFSRNADRPRPDWLPGGD